MPKTTTLFSILLAISLGHLFNDAMQAVIPALFPILQQTMKLSYTQIGWISFTLNMTSSVMQPVFGSMADRNPRPFLLPFAMLLSGIGMAALAFAPNFAFVIGAVLFVGFGSALFHPEGSRVAYLAAGNRRGLAQSIYQVGGNTGSSLAPLFTALIFVPFGQQGASFFLIIAVSGFLLLTYVARWYSEQLQRAKSEQRPKERALIVTNYLPLVLTLLVFIVFARSWYSAAISNFYQFYLLERYSLSIEEAQVYLFVFMIAGVVGTMLGGPLGDRFGKRNVIISSLLGATPFALLLPYASLEWALVLFALIGFILSSSFSVTVVYAQELVPGKVGMVSGLIVGLAFGMGAIGAVVLGKLADATSLAFVMTATSYLPLLGLLAFFLPRDKKR